MNYDELVRHLNYDDVYCDNFETPHKSLLLYSKPLELKQDLAQFTCKGPCG